MPERPWTWTDKQRADRARRLRDDPDDHAIPLEVQGLKVVVVVVER